MLYKLTNSFLFFCEFGIGREKLELGIGDFGMASVSPSSAADPSGEPIPTSAVLMAASRHIGLRCEAENLEFLRCKKKDPNPEKCLDKGQQVTRCVLGLYVSLSLTLISFYSSYVISICAILLLCLGAETERNVEEDEEINMSN